MTEPRQTDVRWLSQVLAEGDGISVIVRVDDVDSAHAAEEQGAEGLVVDRPIDGLRASSALPVLWGESGPPAEAAAAGADACRLVVEDVGDSDRLEAVWAEAASAGLECVVDVRDDEELELALERLDPEIFLLSSRAADDDNDPLDVVLALLPDVPAGKLAIAEVEVRGREDVVALERAGVDGVIVPTGDVRGLVGTGPPEV
jgi:hypothetical protein